MQTPALSVQTSALSDTASVDLRAGQTSALQCRRLLVPAGKLCSTRRGPVTVTAPTSVTPPPRVWTVEVLPHRGSTRLRCTTCGPLGRPAGTAGPRQDALRHLAQHARGSWLPPHLRTCRCSAGGCRWHARHRGCGGDIVLALTQDARSWRLADACRRCASATATTALVCEPHAGSRPALPTAPSRILPWDAEEVDTWWLAPEEDQLLEQGQQLSQ